MALSRRPAIDTFLVAVVLASWALVGVFSPWISIAESASRPVQITFLLWGWALWTIVLVAILVPSPVSATAVRAIAPLAIICSAVDVNAAALFGAIVAVIVVYSSIFIDRLIQGGAYGLEQRFALRTPVPYMAPACIAWLVLMTSTIGSTLFLATSQWIVGVPLAVVGILAVQIIPRRLHRLSRRWLVLVPAGVVLHDHMVLAETVMSPRKDISSLAIVDAHNDNADFTGGVIGPRLSIQLREPDKIVLSKITAKTLRTTEALHVRTYNVAPRRLGAVRTALSF